MTSAVAIKPETRSKEAAATFDGRTVGLLAVILVCYAALALAYARVVPAWQAPDEPAHFNYVKSLAENGQLPVLQPGDYPAKILPLAPRPSSPPNISQFRYESHQPPLYYAIAAVLYKLGARVFALRALSVLFGLLLLVLTYLCIRLIFPGWPAGALAATAFVAFIPMHLFMSASINNDTLSELVLAAFLLLYLAVVNGIEIPHLWLLTGILFGAALLTKVTIYLPAALLAVGVVAAGTRRIAPADAGPNASNRIGPVLRTRRSDSLENVMNTMPPLAAAAREGVGEPTQVRLLAEKRLDRRALLLPALKVALTVAVVSGWWFVRNGLIYGWTDVAALGRQDAVNGGQLHQGSLTWATVNHFFVITFHSFWAQFGWMSVPVSDATYAKLTLFSLLVVAGLVVLAVRTRLGPAPYAVLLPVGEETRGTSAWSLGGLLAVWLAVLAGMLDYNLKFVQEQGRYLFPALIPIATAVVCSVAGLFPRRLQTPALALLSLGLAWFALVSLRHDLMSAFAA